ncbi:phage tail fiber protein, partial [Acinetobacter baumannii]
FATQQNNAGWSISKESVGVYRLQRDAGVTTELTNPHIEVSGIFTGTGLGSGAALLPPTLQAIEAYSGSWSSYKVASGVKLFFRDLTGALVDPMRFSVSFTLESGI